MAIKGVMFDIGGVVRESPRAFLAEYEAEHGLPKGLIEKVARQASRRPDGPLERLERGEILLDEFCRVFDNEFVAQGQEVSTAEIMAGIARAMPVRPQMIEALRRLRAAGFRTGALTTTWSTGEDTGPSGPGAEARDASLAGAFDVYLESSKVGMRKPEPALYELACSELGLEPAEVVYLDEAGVNLKPARKLGMTTIKVEDPNAALAELGALLGIDLLDCGEPDGKESGGREDG